MSCHVDTGEPLPEELQARLIDTQYFQTGLFLLRQLEFAIFDVELHSKPEAVDPTAMLKQIRNEVSVFQPPACNRFAHTFSHIFAGGYAAGYYSYLWAEVLAADAFSRFLEEGLFNPEVGQAFHNTVLAQGGSEPELVLFKRFRGREPRTDALLQLFGLSAA